MDCIDLLGVVAGIGDCERNRHPIYRERGRDARLDECIQPVAVRADIEAVILFPVFRHSRAIVTRDEVLDDIALVVHDGSIRMVDVLLRDDIIADTRHEARFDVIYLLDFGIAVAHLVGD